MKPGKLVQIFFVFLKKIKLKQKCLDFRADRLTQAQEPSAGVTLLNTRFPPLKEGGAGLPPPRGKKPAAWVWVVPVCTSVGGGLEGG